MKRKILRVKKRVENASFIFDLFSFYEYVKILTLLSYKGLVTIDRSKTKPYAAAVSKEFCAKKERNELLDKVYSGAAGDLIAAFLKESSISAEERDRLKKMLDDMEV